MISPPVNKIHILPFCLCSSHEEQENLQMVPSRMKFQPNVRSSVEGIIDAFFQLSSQTENDDGSPSFACLNRTLPEIESRMTATLEGILAPCQLDGMHMVRYMRCIYLPFRNVGQSFNLCGKQAGFARSESYWEYSKRKQRAETAYLVVFCDAIESARSSDPVSATSCAKAIDRLIEDDGWISRHAANDDGSPGTDGMVVKDSTLRETGKGTLDQKAAGIQRRSKQRAGIWLTCLCSCDCDAMESARSSRSVPFSVISCAKRRGFA